MTFTLILAEEVDSLEALSIAVHNSGVCNRGVEDEPVDLGLLWSHVEFSEERIVVGLVQRDVKTGMDASKNQR